tara:strand:- start:2387 stop:2578 length:192 start_codon:yes stop_codon:yes gene_type:complete
MRMHCDEWLRPLVLHSQLLLQIVYAQKYAEIHVRRARLDDSGNATKVGHIARRTARQAKSWVL